MYVLPSVYSFKIMIGLEERKRYNSEDCQGLIRLLQQLRNTEFPIVKNA